METSRKTNGPFGAGIGALLGLIFERRRDRQQLAGACETGLARRPGEQAVVPDAVESGRQDVEQEAADELACATA